MNDIWLWMNKWLTDWLNKPWGGGRWRQMIFWGAILVCLTSVSEPSCVARKIFFKKGNLNVVFLIRLALNKGISKWLSLEAKCGWHVSDDVILWQLTSDSVANQDVWFFNENKNIFFVLNATKKRIDMKFKIFL